MHAWDDISMDGVGDLMQEYDAYQMYQQEKTPAKSRIDFTTDLTLTC